MCITARVEGEIVRVAISGSLDIVTARRLSPVLGCEPVKFNRPVRLDLSQLDTLDSHGVRGLIAVHEHLRAAGNAVTVVLPAGQPLLVLRLLGMVERLDAKAAAAAA